jgi:uncharacterized protein (DUF2336 family)
MLNPFKRLIGGVPAAAPNKTAPHKSAAPTSNGQGHVTTKFARAAEDTRIDLARKIAKILPHIDAATAESVKELTFQALEALSTDHMPRVRAALSVELRSSKHAPKKIIDRLARDAETSVSIPVLQYSELLDDSDLCEVIASGVGPDVLSAISMRANLSATVSEAIGVTLNIPAVSALLRNMTAQIHEDTLDRIIANSKNITEWHEGLAFRTGLSLKTARKIAGFVTNEILQELVQKHNLSPAEAGRLSLAVRQGLAPYLEEECLSEVARTVDQLVRTKKLDEVSISAAITTGHREFVHHALARLARYPVSTIVRILDSKQGNAIVALAWRCRLSMDLAVRLQTRFVHVPAVVRPKGNGYPLDRDAMETILDLYRDAPPASRGGRV